MLAKAPMTLLALAFAATFPLVAQTDPSAGATAQAPGENSPPPQSTAPAQKADALLLYLQGRSLDDAGKTADAAALYTKSVAICDGELSADPKRMDAYAVKCWSLFRLGRHQEVIDVGGNALKIVFDPRIVEVMGESYFFLGKNDLSIQYFTKYLESGKFPDRVSTAYFYLGEIYLRLGKWSHADIAYTTAVKREPSMARWWFRLGQVCEHLEDWRRAADSYSRALSLSPGMKDASEGLARVKPKIGT